MICTKCKEDFNYKDYINFACIIVWGFCNKCMGEYTDKKFKEDIIKSSEEGNQNGKN
jgi:hypothetical protein